eukprot:TRINITY_DN8545_c2_g1_i1.p2 TRINITY_DN8545_c2_g1~~TRINITY_DN8545_c2_g1_i1.p2  ORF type:complete len:178 (-),score=36.69 TRINITY_DN8545_c2_g1_i1:1844-2377(-)
MLQVYSRRQKQPPATTCTPDHPPLLAPSQQGNSFSIPSPQSTQSPQPALSSPPSPPPSSPPPPPPSPPPPNPPARHSTRISKPPDRLSLSAFLTDPDSISIPSSYSHSKEIPKWQDAMTEELLALESNHAWGLVPRPVEAPIIGSKWIYSIKEKSDGNQDKYKAHLVAQGFKQEYGI